MTWGISYEELGESPRVTGKPDGTTILYDPDQPNGSAQAGLAVTFATAADTYKLTVDGSYVVGRLESVGPGPAGSIICTIKRLGEVPLPSGTGGTPAKGSAVVGALNGSGAGGYVRAAVAATLADVAAQRGRVYNNTAPTALVVFLN